MVRNCQKCAVQRAKPHNPQMAAHPKCRLAAYQTPFTYTGMDFFGPIDVKVGRRNEKRWGVIFTCLTVRAVHLEVAHSLSRDSCVKAIENFVARRGVPKEFRCDNGTNFVAAAKVYRGPFGDRPQWIFNPPAAPHMGGAWERLVRSVKQALRQLEMPKQPTDEELRNFLLKAEHMINSRPLTDVPLENEDSESLTPNHFLMGSSSGRRVETKNTDLNSIWSEQQTTLRQFWKKWIAEYLPSIAVRPKWNLPIAKINVGDLVFVCDSEDWRRGRVEETFVDPESDQVRQVVVRTSKGKYKRPTTKIALIPIKADLD